MSSVACCPRCMSSVASVAASQSDQRPSPRPPSICPRVQRAHECSARRAARRPDAPEPHTTPHCCAARRTAPTESEPTAAHNSRASTADARARAQLTREHSARASTAYARAHRTPMRKGAAHSRSSLAERPTRSRAIIEALACSGCADEALSDGRRRGLAGGGRASQAPAHAWQRDGRMRY
jgi:hypothetical protein